MTNYILKFLIPSIFIISCNSEEKKNMNITGSIDGLKKGTLYLQKISDSLIKNVDSIEIDGKLNKNSKIGKNLKTTEIVAIVEIVEISKLIKIFIEFFRPKKFISQEVIIRL